MCSRSSIKVNKRDNKNMLMIILQSVTLEVRSESCQYAADEQDRRIHIRLLVQTRRVVGTS